MTHYVFAEKKEDGISGNAEKWETFAALMAFSALVVLAGITYGALIHGDVYSEVKNHEELNRFSGMLQEAELLRDELEDSNRYFTIIAPTDSAFEERNVIFVSDSNTKADKRSAQIGDQPIFIQSEAYIVRSLVRADDVPFDEVLNLPAANGEIITLSHEAGKKKPLLKANGVPVKEYILADNGVIYLVDSLIHPVLPDVSPSMAQKK